MFDDKQIRKVWLNEQWYFSIIDVIEVTTDSKNPRNYWNVLKKRFTEKEKLDIDNIILYAPLLASNGKEYKAEVTNTEGILRIIMSIPSPKAMSLKLWLAQVSQERLDESENPYKNNSLSISSEKIDEILPYFIVQELPVGISGLIIAGIFAASQSSLSW